MSKIQQQKIQEKIPSELLRYVLGDQKIEDRGAARIGFAGTFAPLAAGSNSEKVTQLILWAPALDPNPHRYVSGKTTNGLGFSFGSASATAALNDYLAFVIDSATDLPFLPVDKENDVPVANNINQLGGINTAGQQGMATARITRGTLSVRSNMSQFPVNGPPTASGTITAGLLSDTRYISFSEPGIKATALNGEYVQTTAIEGVTCVYFRKRDERQHPLAAPNTDLTDTLALQSRQASTSQLQRLSSSVFLRSYDNADMATATDPYKNALFISWCGNLQYNPAPAQINTLLQRLTCVKPGILDSIRVTAKVKQYDTSAGGTIHFRHFFATRAVLSSGVLSPNWIPTVIAEEILCNTQAMQQVPTMNSNIPDELFPGVGSGTPIVASLDVQSTAIRPENTIWIGTMVSVTQSSLANNTPALSVQDFTLESIDTFNPIHIQEIYAIRLDGSLGEEGTQIEGFLEFEGCKTTILTPYTNSSSMKQGPSFPIASQVEKAIDTLAMFRMKQSIWKEATHTEMLNALQRQEMLSTASFDQKIEE